MIAHPGTALAALALVALMLPCGASAGSTATRCDAHGCTHIHCNSTGDRCYRYDDNDLHGGGETCGSCGESGRRLRGISARDEGGTHRLCDSDGDRCYISHSRHWDFRDYYRHQGYRWDD